MTTTTRDWRPIPTATDTLADRTLDAISRRVKIDLEDPRRIPRIEAILCTLVDSQIIKTGWHTTNEHRVFKFADGSSIVVYFHEMEIRRPRLR